MNVVLTAGQLPAGYCWASPQQYLNDIVSVITAALTGNFSGINFGTDTPAPEDQDKPWFRLNADGSPDRWYVFMGQWISPHPIPPSGQQVIIWKDTESALWSYDGGDGKDPTSNPPTAVSGAMWVRDTDFGSDDGTKCFRFPVGAGKNPTAYETNPATSIQPGDEGGDERVVQTLDQLVPHYHPCKKDNIGVSGGGTPVLQDDTSLSVAIGNTENSIGAGDSANNMPPYRGVIFAKRSSRIYLTL